MKELIMSGKKLKLNYPCSWTFKVIGLNPELVEKAVKEILVNKHYQISLSNQSAGGKYISMTLITEVASEEERTGLFEKLKNHNAIKMVL